MAKKTEVKVKNAGEEVRTKVYMTKYRRSRIRAIAKEQGQEALFQRQIPVEDIEEEFSTLPREKRILTPPYSFSRLYEVYENSDALQSCIDAMRMNVDGFGYKLQFLGDDFTEKDSPQAKAEFEKAKNFFDFANDEQSWTTLRRLMREDHEVLGNGGFEVIRNNRQEIAVLYHLPFQTVRLTARDKKPVPIDIYIPRDGRVQKIKVKKHFRKFCQVDATTRKLRWFKEFGDPRIMDATTGDFVAKRPRIAATEVMHFKNAFGGAAYGMPRWIGAMLQVMGRYRANYVNYDLFDSQGIPPMAVMISGGKLTDESLEDLEILLRSTRGTEKWNRILILEAEADVLGLEAKEGKANIELKNLADYRKDDQQFARYLESTMKDVRHRFRLPPLYTGATEVYTYATAKAAQTTAEEQVFNPERFLFDEEVNKIILQKELGITQWRYVSKGPQSIGGPELAKGVSTFVQAGAISVNYAIEIANEAFGLEMSKFDAPWADYPVRIVVELLKLGMLSGVEEITAALPEPGGREVKPSGEQLLLPGPAQKYFRKRDGGVTFSPGEAKLYSMLRSIEDMVESLEVDKYGEGTYSEESAKAA